MKQWGVLALFLIFFATSRATSATARSKRSLQSEQDLVAEAAGGSTGELLLSQGELLVDASAAAAERRALLARLHNAEALTVTERQALRAQQRVLIALEQEQETLESKINALEGNSRASSSDGVVVEKGTTSSTGQKTSLVRQSARPKNPQVYEVAANSAKKVVEAGTSSNKEKGGFLILMRDSEQQFWAKYNKAFWEKMIGIAGYLVESFIFAFIYMQFCKHSTVPKLPETQVRTEEFQFGAFDASDCARDCQMCMCAACCPWIRWADTSSAPPTQFLAFVPGLFITSLLAAGGTVTFGASIPILLLIVVLCRQRIREAYGLPTGTCGVLFGDCLLWICCPCCAIVQEARQVEYVDVPMQEYGQPLNGP